MEDNASVKFRALSAGAVMAFDGQTESHSLPSDTYTEGSRSHELPLP
jgi:hypothetical protein